MCRLSASTQSCPSSSQVGNLALQQLRVGSMRAASVYPEGMNARTGHLCMSWLQTAQFCEARHTSSTAPLASMHVAPHRLAAGSEDGTVRIWHSTTYRLENTLNYGLERCWTVSAIKGSNK